MLLLIPPALVAFGFALLIGAAIFRDVAQPRISCDHGRCSANLLLERAWIRDSGQSRPRPPLNRGSTTGTNACLEIPRIATGIHALRGCNLSKLAVVELKVLRLRMSDQERRHSRRSCLPMNAPSAKLLKLAPAA
jgi:hypothetical protein